MDVESQEKPLAKQWVIEPIAGIVYAALYTSEVWYSRWSNREDYKFVSRSFPLMCKARAVVLYDRILNGRI